MIDSYIQNSDTGMSKDHYYEMCEALGSEPIEEEIPIEITDFPQEVQEAFTMYYMLKDMWDSMGGGYMGKDTSTLFNYFDLYEIEKPDRLFIISIIQHIDYARGKVISNKLNASRKPSSKKA
jgi:hypothetical protein